MDNFGDARLRSPSVARNREPIANVLAAHLPAEGLVLEVASGTGEHAMHFARRFAALTWQPTDRDDAARASVASWIDAEGLTNVRPPLTLDVTSELWPVDRADAVMCINMIHISPWACCEALLAGAARLLDDGAPLFLYGPYNIDGAFTSASNAAFDASLRRRNPAWGIRDLAEVTAAANAVGFAHVDTVQMPANNFSVIFRRGAQ